MSTRKSNTTGDDTASLLMSFTRSLHQHVRATSPEYSFPCMKTMMVARDHGNPTMTQIAEEIGVSSPAITAIIDRLVEDGEMTREEDPSDRRVVRVSMTPRGKTTLEKSLRIWHSAITERLSVLSKVERENLASTLKKLVAA